MFTCTPQGMMTPGPPGNVPSTSSMTALAEDATSHAASSLSFHLSASVSTALLPAGGPHPRIYTSKSRTMVSLLYSQFLLYRHQIKHPSNFMMFIQPVVHFLNPDMTHGFFLSCTVKAAATEELSLKVVVRQSMNPS